ncbi:putative carboxypeptidase S1 [Stipitochalara longipes BDJ]|nr:putative carboxypeptidase S1 [Stipitochalara longipes BDJ]
MNREKVGRVSVLKCHFEYKTFICETTPGVRSWSGYVHLPPSGSRSYPVNTFFWFFESRNDSLHAPLAIWLNGGPGASSMASALAENGPCTVQSDSNSTKLNPWSWNNEINMLYIDQPNQVGFSYDTLANGTLDPLSTTLLPVISEFSATRTSKQNETFFVGTFPSLNSSNTANSTGTASPVVWSFLQTWLEEFPHYNPRSNTLSIWGESYAGHWGIGLASYIQDQNDKITAGKLNDAILIHLDTLGIINGQVDFDLLATSYPDMAYNNTYGFQAITETEYHSAKANVTTCLEMIQKCRVAADIYDPRNIGINATVNSICSAAYGWCYLNHDAFDIGHTTPDPTPSKYEIGFLNQPWVQSALGVPLNFTYQNMIIYNNVMSTGDIVRGGFLESLGKLLDRGVQVTMMYGDRDYICNWLSGERTSLAINSTLSSGFKESGYANITTNFTYVGGVVRQFGNLSFSRVFDAAHGVPYYQPETAFQIFNRAMKHTDIPTGSAPLSPWGDYSTYGPDSSFSTKNQMPVDPEKICYVYAALTTCSIAEMEALGAGTAVVKDWVVVGMEEVTRDEML